MRSPIDQYLKAEKSNSSAVELFFMAVMALGGMTIVGALAYYFVVSGDAVPVF